MKLKLHTIVTGLAIFSILFGAGNVVYPLITGKFAQDQYIFALLGFLTSSIIFAFIGIISMALFEGNYVKFFDRLGKIPGFIMVIIIMLIIGPLGAIPRIITVSYGSIKPFFPSLNLSYFSLIACSIIFLLTLKKNRILDIIGYILTPLLLSSLLLIIIASLFNIPALQKAADTPYKMVFKGFVNGNQTMDLLGALCCSSIVFKILKERKNIKAQNIVPNNKKIFFSTLKASLIGVFLLGLMYVGFIRLSAHYSPHIQDSKNVEMLGVIANNLLGKKASILSSFSVSLACITTAIALSSLFTDFLHEKVFFKKINYKICLLATMIIAFLLSTLNFEGIMKFLSPILKLCYPSLIVLSILNIFHKLYGTKIVKTPVFITLSTSFVFQFVL